MSKTVYDKTNNSLISKTEYLWDGTDLVYQNTYKASNNINDIWYFYYDGNGNVASFYRNGSTYYYKKNLQGDITGILDTNLNEIVTYTYDYSQYYGAFISYKFSYTVSFYVYR